MSTLASKAGVSTGWPNLDDLIGPLAPGTVTTVAGPPGAGVTTVLLNVARHVAMDQGGVVAMSAPGETVEAIRDRIVAAGSGVPLGHRGADDELYAARLAYLRRTAHAPLYLDASAGRSVDQVIRPMLRHAAVQHGGVDLLIVDDPNLLEVAPGVPFDRLMSQVYRDLSEMSREFEVPVLVGGDVSRPARSGARPTLGEMREQAAAALSDTVILVHRDETHRSAAAERVELTVAKARRAPLGAVSLTAEFALARLVGGAR
ncbi:DnaB-like helicase C-terminal domain-containing protein [Micromonospora maritima]|uniref:DnaB-like helicase C-terminal domain-containing protein n=1 Tax=Micromonospora maritima TaxID=986711 RepID=UPI00157DFF79|nr:DnaB-like helicase C-terminal domain-containing protein [Micromonospora maritima]